MQVGKIDVKPTGIRNGHAVCPEAEHFMFIFQQASEHLEIELLIWRKGGRIKIIKPCDQA